MEPPFWYYPMHQSLGAALLAQGKSRVSLLRQRQPFARHFSGLQTNGWAAAGLLRAAEAREDRQAIEEAQALMQKNWFGIGMPAPEQL